MTSSALSPSHERISIPNIWVAFGLSVFLHGVWLFAWIQKPVAPFQEPKLGNPSNTLAIRLVPLTSPPVQPPPAPAARPVPEPAARARPAAPRIPVTPRERAPQPSPPVITAERSTPTAPAVAPPADAPRPAPGQDLAAYIASRRSAREGTAAPAAPDAASESDQQRHNRVVAENLGLTNVPSFGNDPDRGGGVFQVRSMGYDIAEFSFYGWNNAIKRSSLQLIEVRRGGNPNMEIAVVRKMIEIIRERYNGDFQWQSRRLGRSLTLSARPGDTAGLEDFLLKEIFPAGR